MNCGRKLESMGVCSGEEREREREKEKERERERKISSPKASNGQRFPFPAQLVFALNSFFVFMEVSRAADPIGDKVLKNREIFRPSIHLEAWLAGSRAWLAGPEGGRMYIRTDRRTEGPMERQSK